MNLGLGLNLATGAGGLISAVTEAIVVPAGAGSVGIGNISGASDVTDFGLTLTMSKVVWPPASGSVVLASGRGVEWIVYLNSAGEITLSLYNGSGLVATTFDASATSHIVDGEPATIAITRDGSTGDCTLAVTVDGVTNSDSLNSPGQIFDVPVIIWFKFNVNAFGTTLTESKLANGSLTLDAVTTTFDASDFETSSFTTASGHTFDTSGCTLGEL